MATRALGNAGLVFSLFVIMLLIGLWHGFRWTFAVFGLIQAVYLSVDALTARRRRRFYKAHPSANRLTDWAGPVVTFHLVAVALVFFRSAQVGDALHILPAMWILPAQWSPDFTTLIARYGRTILLGLFAYLLTEIGDFLRRHNQQGELVTGLPRWGRWSVYWCTVVTLLAAIMMLRGPGNAHNPFVYAVF
jgi:alginate O-acetyltransferase complex protein AlgI